MIPLKDTVHARRMPVVNWLIIIANVLIFLYEAKLGPTRLQPFATRYGMVPARLFASWSATEIGTLFSSMFLHGGWAHLISNMWALYIFGDNVEDRMGHGRYIIFYLFGGVAAALTHAVLQPYSQIPVIGASGAISAVMGAYMVLFPRARVLALLPGFFFIPWIVHVPALLYIGFWIASQLLNGVLVLSFSGPMGMYGGVAWWAHVGGFAFGLALVKIFEDRRASRMWHEDEYWPW